MSRSSLPSVGPSAEAGAAGLSPRTTLRWFRRSGPLPDPHRVLRRPPPVSLWRPHRVAPLRDTYIATPPAPMQARSLVGFRELSLVFASTRKQASGVRQKGRRARECAGFFCLSPGGRGAAPKTARRGGKPVSHVPLSAVSLRSLLSLPRRGETRSPARVTEQRNRTRRRGPEERRSTPAERSRSRTRSSCDRIPETCETRRIPRKLDRGLALSGFCCEVTMSLRSGSRQSPTSSRGVPSLPRPKPRSIRDRIWEPKLLDAFLSRTEIPSRSKIHPGASLQ